MYVLYGLCWLTTIRSSWTPAVRWTSTVTACSLFQQSWINAVQQSSLISTQHSGGTFFQVLFLVFVWSFYVCTRMVYTTAAAVWCGRLICESTCILAKYSSNRILLPVQTTHRELYCCCCVLEAWSSDSFVVCFRIRNFFFACGMCHVGCVMWNVCGGLTSPRNKWW